MNYIQVRVDYYLNSVKIQLLIVISICYQIEKLTWNTLAQLSNNFAVTIQLLIWNKTDTFVKWSKFKNNFHLDKQFLILVWRYSVGTTWKSQEPDDVDLTVHKQILYTIIRLDKWVLDIAVEKVLDEDYDNGS